MLDQLVESRSNSRENTRKNELILGIFVLMVGVLCSAWLYSLFAKDYGMGGSDLELSSLVAPVPVPDEEPPPPPEQKPDKPQPTKVEPNVVLRTNPMLDTSVSTKVPDTTQTTKNTDKPIPPGMQFKKSNVNFDPTNGLKEGDRGAQNTDTGGIGSGNQGGTPGGTGTAPPPPPPPPSAPPPKPDPPKPAAPKTISGGVVNGKATSLPKPPYPPAARAVHASGAVSVQVLIDESGRVVSASAVSGHPLLRQAAVAAAQSARFSPTVLSGQAVKVSGIITYNFVP